VFARATNPNEFQKGNTLVNLAIWLPALFCLGIATMSLLFAFVAGCDKV